MKTTDTNELLGENAFVRDLPGGNIGEAENDRVPSGEQRQLQLRAKVGHVSGKENRNSFVLKI